MGRKRQRVMVGAVHVLVWLCASVCEHVRGGQRSMTHVFLRQTFYLLLLLRVHDVCMAVCEFSPSTFMWLPGIKLGLLGYTLYHLDVLLPFFLRQGISLNLESTNLSRFPDSELQGSAWLCQHSTGVTHTCALLCPSCWGPRVRFSCYRTNTSPTKPSP